MNIRITYNWLLEYLDTDATPEELQKYLSLSGPSIEKVEKVGDDYAFEIEVTSNRVDMASVMGIAREASAILPQFGKRAALKKRDWSMPDFPSNALEVHMEDRDKLTDMDTAVVMEGLTVGESPVFIKERLEASGIRSLNNLIDITNYVMLEVGHPTHIFDYDRVGTGKLIFRKAKKGEKLMTLDGKEYVLTGDEVVIDDGTGRIIDLPGVMGTKNSVVTNETRKGIYFIDNLQARDVRRTSMTHGIRTMAATYNEKYPDPELTKYALARGLQLFKEYAGAQTLSKKFEIRHKNITPVTIEVTVDFVSSRMGVEMSEEKIVEILANLGFETKSENGSLCITPSTYRAGEVMIPEDIVEEVARIYGYHNLPAEVQATTYVKQPKDIDDLFSLTQKVKYFMKHVGYSEVMNYSLVSHELLAKADIPSEHSIKLKNPLSEEIKFLRSSLIPSLLMNLGDNEGKKDELRFFEIAKVYKPVAGDLPEEVFMLGIATNTSFADIKGATDALAKEMHLKQVEYKKADLVHYSKGIAAQIVVDGETIGEIGQIKPVYQDRFGTEKKLYIAYFNFEELIKHYHLLSTYVSPIQYATIKLDLTVEANNKNFEMIKKAASEASPLLQNMEYLGSFEKKMTLRFYFASREKNITEEDAKRELEAIKKIFV